MVCKLERFPLSTVAQDKTGRSHLKVDHYNWKWLQKNYFKSFFAEAGEEKGGGGGVWLKTKRVSYI